jgi:hypothetical protein
MTLQDRLRALRGNYFGEFGNVIMRQEVIDELDRLQAENEALRKLAEHLRSCRDCGEWDVKDCSEGRPLWDAAMK